MPHFATYETEPQRSAAYLHGPKLPLPRERFSPSTPSRRTRPSASEGRDHQPLLECGLAFIRSSSIGRTERVRPFVGFRLHARQVSANSRERKLKSIPAVLHRLSYTRSQDSQVQTSTLFDCEVLLQYWPLSPILLTSGLHRRKTRGARSPRNCLSCAQRVPRQDWGSGSPDLKIIFPFW
jgi:hypothetical protein